MLLEMKKFGNILNSRPTGMEAVLRAKQIINGSDVSEPIILDFVGVEVLTPSFADEFVSGIKKNYQNRKIIIQGYANNLVLKETLSALRLI